MDKKEKDILEKVNKLLESEGKDSKELNISNTELLNDFLLPALKSSKDVLGSIYAFDSRERSGLLGNIKSKVQRKIINTVINVVEKQSMRQQKFNDLMYKSIEILIEENSSLKKK